MIRLTDLDIKEINESKDFDSWYQGIYKEAFGVPDKMKDMAIYMRWSTGGASGGSCWDTEEDDGAQPYDGESEPKFIVLDKVLAKIVPTLTFSDYREIEKCIISTETSEYHYYGNYDDWGIKYLPLPVLYKKLEELGY